MTDNEHRPPEPPQGRDPGREPDDRSRQTTLNGVPVPSSNMNDLRELKKAQTMVMVASVAGPVSLFIGGVLLSGVGLACAIIALRKLNKLIEKRTDVSALAQRLKRSAIVGVAVCGVHAQCDFVLSDDARSTRDDGKRRLRGSCDGCRDRRCRIDLDLGIILSAVETA